MKETNNNCAVAFIRRCKCVFMAVLILLMTFTFMSVRPLKAHAVEEYWLYFCGKKVTSENAGDIMGDGNFSYSNATKTLTIKGDLVCSGKMPVPLLENAGIEGLKICVEKDSTLTQPFVNPALYIKADTMITGPGVLNVEGGIRTVSVSDCKLTIQNAKINVLNTNTDHAAAAIGGTDGDSPSSVHRCSLEIKDSHVTAKNENNKQLPAITDFRKELTLEGCEPVDPSASKRTVLNIEDGAILDNSNEYVHDVLIERVYALQILEKQVYDSNKADILGDGIFTYDENTNTLTINGNFQTDSNLSLINNHIQGLTITTASDTIISCVNAWFIDNHQLLNLTTKGKLTVLAGEIGIGAWVSVHIKDADLNIESQFGAITSLEKRTYERMYLSINNSDVTLTSKTQEAVGGFGKIELNNCEIVTPENGVVCLHEGTRTISDPQGNYASKVVISKSQSAAGTTTTTTSTTTTTTTATTTTTTAPVFSLSCEKTELEVGESVDVAILNWDNDASLLNPTIMTGNSIAITPYHTPRFTVTGVKAGVSKVIVKSSQGVEKTITFTVRDRQAAKKPGDANCDGLVDMSDAVLIMQAIANPNTYGINGSASSHITAEGWKNADVDGNGLTVGDALAIQEYLLGVRTTLGSAE